MVKGDKFNIHKKVNDKSAPNVERLSVDSPDMGKKSESDTGYF